MIPPPSPRTLPKRTIEPKCIFGKNFRGFQCQLLTCLPQVFGIKLHSQPFWEKVESMTSLWSVSLIMLYIQKKTLNHTEGESYELQIKLQLSRKSSLNNSEQIFIQLFIRVSACRCAGNDTCENPQVQVTRWR